MQWVKIMHHKSNIQLINRTAIFSDGLEENIILHKTIEAYSQPLYQTEKKSESSQKVKEVNEAGLNLTAHEHEHTVQLRFNYQCPA